MERKGFRLIMNSISVNNKSSRPAHQSSKMLYRCSWYGKKKNVTKIISSTQPNINIAVTEQLILFKLWYSSPNIPHKCDQLGGSCRRRDRGQSVKDYTNLLPTTHKRVLLCLMRSWTGRSKNVTRDNFFTSLTSILRETLSGRSCEKEKKKVMETLCICAWQSGALQCSVSVVLTCGRKPNSWLSLCAQIVSLWRSVGQRGRGSQRQVTYYSCTHGLEDVMCRTGSVQSVMDGRSILQFAWLVAIYACFMHNILPCVSCFMFPTQIAELRRKPPVRDTVRHKVKSGLFKKIKKMFVYGKSVP